MDIEVLIELAERSGWHTELYDNPLDTLPEVVAPWLTEENAPLTEFLRRVRCMENSRQTVWILTAEDYEGDESKVFRWDEFRQISLEAAYDDEEREDVERFWSRYLPVCMSVGDGYEYYAVDDCGEMIHGWEPMFEDAERLDGDFESVIEDILRERGHA